MKSSSKVVTKAKGVTPTGQRRTDFLYMVASLGRPAATIPQLGPSFDATNDITKPPSSDNNKPVVVLLAAHCDGWVLGVAQAPLMIWEEAQSNCIVTSWWQAVPASRGDEPETQVNLGAPKDSLRRAKKLTDSRFQRSTFSQLLGSSSCCNTYRRFSLKQADHGAHRCMMWSSTER